MPNKGSAKQHKKDLALDLYLRSDKTREQIAALCEIHPNTLANWIKKDNWENIKSAEVAIAPKVIDNLYKKILSLSESDDKSTKFAREIAMLVNAIEKISHKPVLSHYIECFKAFNQYLIDSGDFQTAKLLNEKQAHFIQFKSRQL